VNEQVSVVVNEEWRVPGALEGERVDRVLALITGLSRREVNRLIDEGQVTLEGHSISSRSRKVRRGERLGVEGQIEPEATAALAADPSVPVPVVWCDDEVIVVDKPAGVVVHPGAGHRSATLVHGLLARFPELAGIEDPAGPANSGPRPGIVHRLDRGTSGLMVVARSDSARTALVRQLARREVGREYTTLVAGSVESDAGLVDAPLGRHDSDPTRMRVQTGGRDARTRYEVQARFGEPVATSLLRCRLETGRTHQIRVHLASIGHPVIGDDRYGPGRRGWSPLPPGRPFLHAAELSFDHPSTAQRMRFSSPLPADLRAVLRTVSAGLTPGGPTH
jgi:23S rRNA pseudouridine1911/1915/1917 synthase